MFSDENLYLDLKPSARVLVVFAAVHGLGLLGLIANPIFHNALGAYLALALLVSLVVVASEHALLLAPQSIIRLVLSNGRFRIVCAGGEQKNVQLIEPIIIWTGLVVMIFREHGRWVRRRYVVLMRDSVDADSFRRTRVMLRYGRLLNAGGGNKTV